MFSSPTDISSPLFIYAYMKTNGYMTSEFGGVTPYKLSTALMMFSTMGRIGFITLVISLIFLITELILEKYATITWHLS